MTPNSSLSEEQKEQRLAAQREYMRNYRAAHREELAEKKRTWYAIKRNRVLAQNQANRLRKLPYETLPDDDSSIATRDATSILAAIDCPDNEFYDDLVKYLKDNTELNDEQIKIVYQKAASAYNSSVARHGFNFEREIRLYLLQQLKDSGIYVYYQVRFSGCRVDFVVSAEANDREKLDMTKAFIVSTKTRMTNAWREDMHLYNKCKAYVLLTLDDRVPSDTLPDNVYFCSVKNNTTLNHILSFADLIPTIKKVLLQEDSTDV